MSEKRAQRCPNNRVDGADGCVVAITGEQESVDDQSAIGDGMFE